jgi:tetratricopeptide (TPR) repeat protein
MICPRCGFSQPDDLYCARCGVHVKQYRQKKKKRLFILGSALILFGIAALFAGRVYQGKQARVATVEAPSPPVSRPEKQILVTEPKGEAPVTKRASPSGSSGQKKPVALTAPSRLPVTPASTETETPSGKKGENPAAGEKAGELSGLQWFEKGMALNDDSPDEIAFYQKAVESDPEFAPAYYRLGAIYFRNAEYELADQAFAQFLKFANEEQRGRYDIYVFYSPAEVESLMGEESQPGAEGDSKKQTAGEEPSTSVGKEEKTENNGLDSREMQTAIPFEKLGDQIVVRVRLNRDITARMLLDTGAGITVLSDTLAERLKLTRNGDETLLLKTLSREMRVPLAHISALQLGAHTREDMPVAVCSMGPAKASFEGILGMDFLRGFTITVDAPAKKISLKVVRPPQKKIP